MSRGIHNIHNSHNIHSANKGSNGLLANMFAIIGIKYNLKTFLVASFVIISFFALLALGLISYYVSLNAIKKNINDNLLAVHRNKVNEISSILTNQVSSIKSLASSKFIQDASVAYESIAFGAGIDISQDTPLDQKYYTDLDNKYKEIFQELLFQYGIKNLGIIQSGGIVIAQAKRDIFLGKNLITGSFKDTNLAKIFNSIGKVEVSNSRAYLVDLFYSDKLGRMASFLLFPMFSKYDRDGYSKNERMATLYVELDWELINIISKFTTGLGSTGEIYLIGSDRKLRTDTRSSDSKYTLGNQYAGNAVSEEGKLKSPIIDKVLAFASDNSETGRILIEETTNYKGKSVLSVGSIENFLDNKWAVMVEMTTKEAYEPIVKMGYIIFIVSLAVLVAAIIFGLNNR
ncbi:MAG: hypothetical protein HQK49_00740 [Oligoflexia bacterium]|nr:hypothetical protein [Oligoflexia bacterium]